MHLWQIFAFLAARLLDNEPAHDSWNRWLSEVKLRPSILWEDIQHVVDLEGGYLIVDDSVADKWYTKQIELVKKQYSGTHHRIVEGIGVVSLLWTKHQEAEKAEHYIVDMRIYAPKYDGKTKNHHCRDMLESAFHRGFRSPLVLMDRWYQDTKTLKLIRCMEWTSVSGLKSNRQVHITAAEPYKSVAEVATKEAVKCWMKKFCHIKLLKIVRPKDGNIEYLATNDLSLPAPVIRAANACRWRVEEYHRGTKQLTGLETCQARRNQRAQRNHILCSIRALLALEQLRLERGIPWYEAKQQLIVEALSNYLKNPTIPLTYASA